MDEINPDLRTLLDLWYLVVGMDHHKDKDCHFYVKKVLSLDYCPYHDSLIEPSEYWAVEHYGYVGPEIEEQFETEREALIFLRGKLVQMIRKECIWMRDEQGDAFILKKCGKRITAILTAIKPFEQYEKDGDTDD